jgi:hypothetical protein
MKRRASCADAILTLMRLGNNVKLVEHTNQRVVVAEPGHYPAGFFCLLSGALSILLLLNRNPHRLGPITLTVTAAWLLGLGLFCCLNSTFTADYAETSLLVHRAVWAVEWERRYPFTEIEAVSIRKTRTGGNGLLLRLISGKSKSLTLSLHFQLLYTEQAALDHAIRRGQAKARRASEHHGLRA